MDALRAIGFGEQEAKVYLTLLRRGDLTGYELAAAAGVPRPNVYTVLQRLEERGAVLRHEGPRGTHWAATPPGELLARAQSSYVRAIEAAREALAGVEVAALPDKPWTLHGRPAALAHAEALLIGAQKELLIALWPAEAAALAPEIAATEERGLAITTLCLSQCAQPCGGCRGRLYRYPVAPAERHRWLVVVADGAEALVADLPGGDEGLAIRSRQQVLVALATWYLRHSIAVAAIVRDLGPAGCERLSPEARAALIAAGSAVEGDGGWWSQMWDLVKPAAPA